MVLGGSGILGGNELRVNTRTILFIFNLSMDLDNPILATSNLWVNEMAKEFEKVFVYSTHVGRYQVESNTTVFELGGGTMVKRIRAITRLTQAMYKLFCMRKNSAVFHHQSTRTAFYPGLIFKLFSIPQCIWYSHTSKPITLLLSNHIVDRIFSSSIESFPLATRKLVPLGHGIDVERAGAAFLDAPDTRKGVIFAGRIYPIKNLEECIVAISKSTIKDKSFWKHNERFDSFTNYYNGNDDGFQWEMVNCSKCDCSKPVF
jgi:hypothetical protein